MVHSYRGEQRFIRLHVARAEVSYKLKTQNPNRRSKSSSVDTAASFGSMDAVAETTGTVIAATRRSICTLASRRL